MNLPELLRWQASGYPRYHARKSNLLLHIVAVPAFLLGNVMLLASLWLGAWGWALASLVPMVLSLAAQGRGHRMEAVPAEPFTGPVQAVARLFFEQWVTFPRFVLSGGWLRAFRQT
ncbi:terminase [Rhodoferax aquaticus]|uniref:Terminase n=1 Tax=Rhodoferax aquaticus TaxID=2527691 RepID=A0A515ESS2_9BURK|nr:terminase [Rhodoferax aquaticus]QDL55722.1 terminase [Rhodoferax aquaticus]